MKTAVTEVSFSSVTRVSFSFHTELVKGERILNKNSLRVEGVQYSQDGLLAYMKEDGMTETWQRLAHSRWECKYQVVFITKYSRKVIYGEIRENLGGILYELARQKECRIVEGHLLAEYVHMCIEI